MTINGSRRRTELALSFTEAAASVFLRRWRATNTVARVDGVHVVSGGCDFVQKRKVRIHHLISFPSDLAKSLPCVSFWWSRVSGTGATLWILVGPGARNRDAGTTLGRLKGGY